MYEYDIEAQKVIELRDKLVNQAEELNLLTADPSLLSPELLGFSRRYRRHVLEKEIHRRREEVKPKSKWLHDGKLHLLEPEEIEETSSSDYQKKLKQAVKVEQSNLPASGGYNPISRRPPPPSSDLLPYEDDYKPMNTNNNTPTNEDVDGAGNEPLIPGLTHLGQQPSLEPEQTQGSEIPLYSDASPNEPNPTNNAMSSSETRQSNLNNYQPPLPSLTQFTRTVNINQNKRNTNAIYGYPSYEDECLPY